MKLSNIFAPIAAIPTLIADQPLLFKKPDQLPHRAPPIPPSKKLDQILYNYAGPQSALAVDWQEITDLVSPLVRKGGIVLEMGGHSGQYAAFLARARPDLQVYAIEQNPDKFALAQSNPLPSNMTLLKSSPEETLKMLHEQGKPPNALVSAYPSSSRTNAEMINMLTTFATAQNQGASLVLFDINRPNQQNTVETMARVYPAPDSDPAFNDYYAKALRSSFRRPELEALMCQAGIQRGQTITLSPLGQFNIFVAKGENIPRQTPPPIYPEQQGYERFTQIQLQAAMTIGQFASPLTQPPLTCPP